MGVLTQFREELDELAGELEDASTVGEGAQQPAITMAYTAIVSARDSLSSAFLSHRGMVETRASIARAQKLVSAAVATSLNLRARSAILKAEAVEIRSAGALARGAAGWRARLGGRSDRGESPRVAGTVDLVSGIPDDHPHKHEIETALEQALAAGGGHWQVWITVPPGGSWWGLRIKGPAINWVETLHGVNDQTAEAIVACVDPLARLVRAEALYAAELRRRAEP